MVETKTAGQEPTLCMWYAQAAAAVRSVIDETPGGAIVIHRKSIPELICDEDPSMDLASFTRLRMKGLSCALHRREGLRSGLYDDLCNDVVVIFDPTRTSLSKAKDEVKPNGAYAPEVRAALLAAS